MKGWGVEILESMQLSRRAKMLCQTPLGRIADSGDAAGVVFLCADAARLAAGVDLRIAGGRDMAF